MGSTTATTRQFHEDVDDIGGYEAAGRVELVVRPPSNLLKDLKVTVQYKSLVSPSHETEKRSIFLSNIDQVLNFDVQTVHFFASHNEFSSDLVAEKLKQSLTNILVPYDFLAGRLKLNPNSSTGGIRLAIECNAAGAGFLVASSEYALHEIGDLVYPNSAFAQLVCITMDMDRENDASIKHPASAGHRDHPLCILQVQCAKIQVRWICNGHINQSFIFDGQSFRLFLDNLAALAGDKLLAIIPYSDREILAARSPPRIAFPHPELQDLKMCTQLGQDDDHLSSTVFEVTQEELDFKIFRLSRVDLIKLKEKAKPTSSSSSTEGGTQSISSSRGVTSFNVVTALIWRCKALPACDDQYGDDDGMDRESRILYAVDIRPRLTPPLPRSYTGNAVLIAYASARCRELEQAPFSRTVEMVHEGAERMTNEYVTSVIDWGELHKGFPHGDVLVSSWWKLGFEEVEYPWGKPRYSCPVAYHRKDVILLFPDEQIDAGCGGRNGGVNILVALPYDEMQKFQTLFLKFLLGD